MRYIDLRSDTVTQPTEQMRKAMANAVVGDDVYQDDPTVNELERLAAEMLGMEAALFVSSGTMGNQLAVMSATKRGDEIIVGDTYHLFESEAGGVAVLSGVNMRTLPYVHGMPDVDMIKNAIRTVDIHYPDTSMICLENAIGSGLIVPIDTMEQIYGIAKEHNIHVHVDGARAFNAATALGCDIKEITKNCDSIMCCLAKGLCAPIGSILAGKKEFIDRARRFRKMLGGGTRQAGIIAAAGIIGLTDMTKRLYQDHETAKYLATRLSEFDCIDIDVDSVKINMIFCKINKPMEVLLSIPEILLEKGVKVNGVNFTGLFRFLTSNDVSKDDIDVVIGYLKEILA